MYLLFLGANLSPERDNKIHLKEAPKSKKYVERTNPGKFVSGDVQHLTNVTFLSTDGVLLANQLNPTLFYKAMFNKNVFNNNCLFFISK